MELNEKHIRCQQCGVANKKNYYLWLVDEKAWEVGCALCGKFKQDLDGKIIAKKMQGTLL